MSIITVGIDLAKNIFAVHGVNEAGKPELIKTAEAAQRSKSGTLRGFIAQRPC